MSHSFQKVLDEMGQAAPLRRPLLENISEQYDRNVVSYYASFGPHGILGNQDAEVLLDIVSSFENDKKLILIINSPGGDPLAAERIIKICREFSDNDYWVFAPGMAKSAATMVSLGASKIFMTNTSELGPIDVQVPWENELVPAHIIISTYEELLEKGLHLPQNQRIEPILQQLQVFSSPQIERWRLARDLAKDIAQKVLREGAFRGVEEGELVRFLQKMIDPTEQKDHGRPIFYTDLLEIDTGRRLNIELISQSHSLWSPLHEYHIRVSLSMNQRTAKVIETVKHSFTFQAS